MSRTDQIWRSLILTKFFVKGWGKPDNLKRILEFRKVMSNRSKAQYLVPADYPVHIDKEREEKHCLVKEGHFLSPLTGHLPGVMPEAAHMARFQVILPKQWSGELRPICLHLGGTGDHGFYRRRIIAKALLAESGIASIILENPYYGCRKPKQQLRSSLHYVSDLFVMGAGLVLESAALFHWCHRQGYGPLGITGISMGGYMASLAACNWKDPISLIPCLSWSSASPVFMKGVMADSIPWDLLQKQYESDAVYGQEINKMAHSPELHKIDPFYKLGQDCIKNYPKTVEDMKSIQDLSELGDLSALTAAELLELRRLLNIQGQGSPAVAKETAQPKTIVRRKHKDIYMPSDHIALDMADIESLADSILPGSAGKMHGLIAILGKLAGKQSTDKQREPVSGARRETLHFMQGLLDECTHLGNYSVPVDPSLAIIVQARNDAYIVSDTILPLSELWPGSEVRYLEDHGHVDATIFRQDAFRKSIIDSFDRQIAKYYSNSSTPYTSLARQR